MPRYDNLPLEQLETIRKFIEESDTIDAANPAELDDPRALVEMHWPHLLHKLPPHTGQRPSLGVLKSWDSVKKSPATRRAH